MVKSGCPSDILRRHRLQIPKSIVFLSLKIDVDLANSVRPGEMPHFSGISLFNKVPI